MKKVLMMVFPLSILLGGYIFCSNIFYEPWQKAGVTFVLFLQLGIYFFQGLMCGFVNIAKINKIISISVSLIASAVVMVLSDFLGIDVMAFVLFFCIIMYVMGYITHKGIVRIINKIKKG